MKLVSRKILQNTGLMFFAALGVLLAPPRTACAAPTGYQNTVLADSPYLYYRFGESSGTTVIDSSVNGFNGTYVNGVTLGLAGDTPAAAATRPLFSLTPILNMPCQRERRSVWKLCRRFQLRVRVCDHRHQLRHDAGRWRERRLHGCLPGFLE